MNNRMKAGKKSGFTLIELLVVISILGILIGIVFSAGKYVFSDQETKQAKVQLGIIAAALEEFKLNNGDYPEALCESSLDDDEMARGFLLLKALCKAKDKEEILGPGSVKLLPIGSLSIGEMLDNQEVVFMQDPWGNPFVYAYPRPDGKSGYLLFSKGADSLCSDYTVDDSESEPFPIDADNI